MAKFNFNLRDASATSLTPIYLIVRWDNLIVKVPTQESINPINWNSKKQRGVETKKFPEFPEFNYRLTEIHSDAQDVFRKFVNDNKRNPTKTELKTLLDEKLSLKPVIVEDKDLINYITKFTEESKVRYGKNNKPISKSTIKLLNQFKRLIEEYSKYKKRRFVFDDITLDFYYDFLKYMNEVKLYATNTSGRRIKDLKIILRDASERGVNTNYAYTNKNFKIISEVTDSIYLNEEELDLMYKLDLSHSPKLDRVRDMFLIGCWTGLRFSDFSKLTKEQVNNVKFEVKTQKTDTNIVLPKHHVLISILKKYNGDLPRMISNQKMNEYLKEICVMIPELNVPSSKTLTKGGFKVSESKMKYELVSSHTGRRSFATNMYLDNVPIFHIMQITGHQTEKQFLEYIKITPNESAKIIEIHWAKKYNSNIV
jgi:integrase